MTNACYSQPFTLFIKTPSHQRCCCVLFFPHSAVSSLQKDPLSKRPVLHYITTTLFLGQLSSTGGVKKWSHLSRLFYVHLLSREHTLVALLRCNNAMGAIETEHTILIAIALITFLQTHCKRFYKRYCNRRTMSAPNGNMKRLQHRQRLRYTWLLGNWRAGKIDQCNSEARVATTKQQLRYISTNGRIFARIDKQTSKQSTCPTPVPTSAMFLLIVSQSLLSRVRVLRWYRRYRYSVELSSLWKRKLELNTALGPLGTICCANRFPNFPAVDFLPEKLFPAMRRKMGRADRMVLSACMLRYQYQPGG